MTDNLHLGGSGLPSKQAKERGGRWIGGGLESISSVSANEAFYLSMIMQACIIQVG